MSRPVDDLAGFLKSLEAALGRPVTPVAPVDSASLQEYQPGNFILVPEGAGQLTRVINRQFKVQSVAFQAGPRNDGVTANAGNIFIGGKNASQTEGWLLTPGQTLAVDSVDLGNWYATFTNAADRLRILVLT